MKESIETTIDKAKFVRPYIEKLVTKAKKVSSEEDKVKYFNTVKFLKNKISEDEAVRKLLEEVAPKYKKTPGGYTSIKRTRNRVGDNAVMAVISFTRKKQKKAPEEKKKDSEKPKKPAEKKVKKAPKKRVKKDEKAK